MWSGGKVAAHPFVAWSVLIVGAALFVSVGLVAGLMLAPVSAPAGLASATPPMSAPATVRQFSDTRPVTVTLTMGVGVPLVAHRGGIVTTAPNGSRVESGQAALWVDGSPVIALATSAPLYRSLAVNDKGADAAALNDELTRLGYDAPQSGVFTKQTSRAWQALQTALGAPSPQKTVDLGRTLWLPSPTVDVGSWQVLMGVSVPPDTVLAVVPGQVASAQVIMADGSALPGGSRTVTVGTASAPLRGDGIVTDAAFLAAAQAEATTVQTDGTEPRLQASGTTEFAEPLTVLSVPPVAVFDIAGDRACVQVSDSGVPVTIVGSSLGATLVQPVDGSAFDRVAIGAGITVTGC